MNAAIYARVSTKIQAEHGHSIETQLAACHDRAAALGSQTVKEYVDDGYSGAYLERPALDALRDALRDKLHDLVIIYDPDRLSRNLAHQLLLTEEIEKHGAKLVFISTDFQNNPEGRMFYQMRGVFAAYEREKFRERSMRGRRGMQKKGLVVQDSHVYGYDYDKEMRQYTVNPAEAETIRWIINTYLDGSLGGVNAILLHLNREKVPPPMHGKEWNVKTIRDILTRDMYSGEYFAGRYYHTYTDAKHEVKIPRDKSEWIPLKCPPIIEKEKIEAAKVKLATNRTKRIYPHVTGEILLQGIAYCPLCGHRLSVSANPDKKTKTREVKYRRFYTCHRYCTRRGEPITCPNRMISIDKADKFFWKFLKTLCLNKKSLQNHIGSHTFRPRTRDENSIELLTKRLETIANERKAVMSWFSKSLISQDDATAKLNELKQRETSVREKLEAANEKPKPATIDTEAIMRAVSSCNDSFSARRKCVLYHIDKVYLLRTDKTKGASSKYELSIKIEFKPS